MTDYIKTLEDGIVNKRVIAKFDSLMAILMNRVNDSFYKRTAEESEPLQDALKNMYGSFSRAYVNIGGEYNCDVDIGSLTDVQIAFLQGEFCAYLNVVSSIMMSRPLKAELDFALENVETLKTLEHVEYVPELHGDFYAHGLIIVHMHGLTRVCTLTPFAKDVIGGTYAR